MKGPWRALLVQGSSQIFDFLQPDPNEKNYSSGTKDGIDPKPGPNFEFVHCLKVYKKIINLDHQRTLAGPFCAMVPSKEPCFVPNKNESVQLGKAMF